MSRFMKKINSAVQPYHPMPRQDVGPQQVVDPAYGNDHAQDELRQAQLRRTLGWRPSAEEPGPFAYIEGDHRPSNACLRMGVGGHQEDGLDVLDAQWQGGVCDDQIGLSTRAGLWNGEYESEDTGLGIEGRVFHANADAHVGENGFALGGQATVLEAAYKTGRHDPNSCDDTNIRLGGGIGAGGAIRGHWSDPDQDGCTDYGFGVDLGFITLDATWETEGAAAGYRALWEHMLRQDEEEPGWATLDYGSEEEEQPVQLLDWDAYRQQEAPTTPY